MTHIMNWSTAAILAFNAILLVMSLCRIKKTHGIGGAGCTSDKALQLATGNEILGAAE
jgi:hypothetical protein